MAPDLPLILLIPYKLGPSPDVKKLFLQLSEWGDELLSTQKIIIFPGKPLVGSNYRKYWPYLEKIATETFVIFSSCMGP